MITFQEVILRLQQYWNKQGCALLQPIDIEVGAGTSHTATFLRALGPEPWRAAYVQPSRRPKDARYGENPNRLHQHHQFQVVLKPAPVNIVDLYLDSLRALGIDTEVNDIRFVEDNWENPTLGAWGLGWEVWMNGMEVTQFTYFQQVGGLECLTMYLQNCDNVFDLVYTNWKDGMGKEHTLTYGDVFHQNEVEQSHYNFEASDPEKLFKQFDYFEGEAKRLMEAQLHCPPTKWFLRPATPSTFWMPAAPSASRNVPRTFPASASSAAKSPRATTTPANVWAFRCARAPRRSNSSETDRELKSR